MKVLKNYWFLQEPIDVEYKFYVLMDFLQSVEEDISNKKYNDQIQRIRRIHEDLKTFRDSKNLCGRTLNTMPPAEIEKFQTLQAFAKDRDDEVQGVIENSLTVVEEFLSKLDPLIKEINSLIDIYPHEGEQKKFKDQGFLALRIPGKRKIKYYSWSFSFIKVKQKDQIGILITELLDPLPKYSAADKKIVSFFQDEIKIFNPSLDSFVFANLGGIKREEDIGFDLMKERGIEFIADSYKKHLSA